MYVLKDKGLWAGDAPLLTDISDAIDAEIDPGQRGAFLRINPLTLSPTCRIALGNLSATRFAALHRYEPFWMRPVIVECVNDIPPETQVLFAQLPDSRTVLFVPLADAQTRASLEGTSDGLCLTVEAGNPRINVGKIYALFLAVQRLGQSLDALLSEAAAAVAEKLRVPLRISKPLPQFIDRLGWCTWDAFYQEVSAEKIWEGLESFRAAGVPVGFLIVDDGWQTVRDFGEEKGKRLTGFVPNEKFGGDFSGVVRMAKGEFGVKEVLAWHSIIGYWAGVDVERFAAYGAREVGRSFSEGILRHMPEANTKWWGAAAGAIPAENVGRFFEDYHAVLKSQGIDGVKVDNQAVLEGLLLQGNSRGTVYSRYRAELEASVEKHFGGNVLHCMSCANDLLYSPTGCLTRTSTDFWPNKPETHGLHVWTNAVVSLWFGHFVHPDWDMFQSKTVGSNWGRFHGAARAISGGPVYVSDKPGEHDVELLRSLVLSNGSVPRCDRPAAIAAECVFKDSTREDVLLKIVNTNRDGAVGVVGLFNCRYDSDHPMAAISGTVSASDVPEIGGQERYLMNLKVNPKAMGRIWRGPKVVGADERVPISLGQGEFEIATFFPIEDGVAVIGLLTFLNTAATASVVARDADMIRIATRDAGTLSIWVECPVAGIECDGARLKWNSIGFWHWVGVPRAGEVVVRLG